MTPAREKYALVLADLALAALLLLIGSFTWVHIVFVPGALPFDQLDRTGLAILPSLVALSLASLVVGATLTIAGRTFRRVLGLVQVLLSVGIVASIATVIAEPIATSSTEIAAMSGVSGDAQRALIASADLSVAVWLAIIAAALQVVVGAIIVVRSGRWPRSGARYEQAAPATKADDAVSEWDDLSRGDDPTAEQ